MSALVTSFDKTIRQFWRDATVLNQLVRVGFLFQVESLLSTIGSEVAMLEGTPSYHCSDNMGAGG